MLVGLAFKKTSHSPGANLPEVLAQDGHGRKKSAQIPVDIDINVLLLKGFKTNVCEPSSIQLHVLEDPPPILGQ